MSSRIKWRVASIRPTIPVFPGIGVTPLAFLPLLIWFVWWSWTTLYIAFAALALSVVMSLRGMTFARLTSYIRLLIRGRTIQARPWWYLKRFAPGPTRIGDLRSDLSYLDLDDE